MPSVWNTAGKKTRESFWKRVLYAMLSAMEGCTILLNQALRHLAPSEAKVATYILEHPQDAVSMSITDLAEKAGSSAAAVVRLCKRLQFDGYAELKLSLAKEVYGNTPSVGGPYLFDVKQAQNSEQITSMMVQAVCENITKVVSVLSTKSLDKTLDALNGAHKILLAGIGASALAAMDLYQKLGRLGMYASFPSEQDLQIVNACSLDEQSVCLVFSYSGETRSMLTVAQKAKQSGATVIAITRIGGNSLSKLSDQVLAVPDSEALYRQGASLSRLSQLVVVDILYSCLIARRSDADAFINATWKAVSREGL